MQIGEAQKNLTTLVDKVYREGITIDLERDNKVVAKLAPASGSSTLTVSQLGAFLRALPPLAEDADAFAQDVRSIRAAFPAEASPWD